MKEWTMSRRRDGHYEVRRTSVLYAVIYHRSEGDLAGFQFFSAVRRKARPAEPMPTLEAALKASRQYEPQLISHLLRQVETSPREKGSFR